jgi:hypothetical protein
VRIECRGGQGPQWVVVDSPDQPRLVFLAPYDGPALSGVARCGSAAALDVGPTVVPLPEPDGATLPALVLLALLARWRQRRLG